MKSPMTPQPHCIKEDVCQRYLSAHSGYNEDEPDTSEPCIFSCMKRASRHAPAPEPKFNSTDLLLLANDEWKRREERKHNHENAPWCAGFVNGFLTDKKWAREMVDKIRTGGEPR